MAQGLIYAFVARRPSTVLCDHTAYSGNFSVVALQCLEKLPASETCRMTYTCDRHTFNYLCHGGFAFLAVADEDYGRQVVSGAHVAAPHAGSAGAPARPRPGRLRDATRRANAHREEANARASERGRARLC